MRQSWFRYWKIIFSLSTLVLFFPKLSYAHRDDYLNETFVFQTLHKGEFDPEYSFDYHHARSGHEHFFLNSLAFEAGLTHHLMIDGIATLRTTTSGENSFRRARAETRYRFGEEGDRFIDMATSLEYELENEDGEKEHFLSPRLVLSKDLTEKLNVTLNLFTELRVSESLKARAGYALAMRYPGAAFIRYGVEFQGMHPTPDELLVLPQIWFAFAHETTLKAGFGAYLVHPEEQFFTRLVLEKEF